MKRGTLYGIGVGPGDPELISVRGVNVMRKCSHVFVPIARIKAESVALSIAKRYVPDAARIHEVVFPMVTDRDELQDRWDESAELVARVLEEGHDACFLTLGDPLLYSTYIYLVRALRQRLQDCEVVTVPGITAFSAVAALTDFPVGESKEPVVIVPTADDLEDVRRALDMGGTVILMKIGKRLNAVLDLLEETNTLERGVFVARAGMPEQRIETDLNRLRGSGAEIGYLSTMLIHAGKDPT